MRAPTTKWIPAEEGIKNFEYGGYKTVDRPTVSTLCPLVYKGNGIGLAWNEEGQVVENIVELERHLTMEETEQWYKDHYIMDAREQLNLYGLFTDLYDTGDAYHEMWNAWISDDWYEMSNQLQDLTFILAGIAPCPWGKDDLFGEGKTVAFVAEDDNGERFWCHGSIDWVDDIREQMKDIYENYKR